MLPPLIYGRHFFDYVEAHAARAARIVAPLVIQALAVESILDVGCGTGVWLSAYGVCGVSDLVGIDGAYVDRQRLLIPARAFRALDVGAPFDLGRSFDLAQSLEVAEHLPRESGPTHVANLTRHAPYVLFSAAIPGQGGTHHVNERSPEYWRALFATHGFEPFDCLRPQLRAHPEVASWYANNTVLYVSDRAVTRLPHAVRRTRVPDAAAIPLLWPMSFRVRAAVLRALPVPVVTRLAGWRHRLVGSIEAGTPR